MRKVIVVLVVVALSVISIFLISFRNSSYELETLTEKFNEYYNEIELITDKYKLENKCWVTDKINSLKQYYVIVNDKQRIDITFSTTATKKKKGNGTFSISYTISDVSEDNNFDVELFTEIVNSISDKPITTDFVTEFLTAPEEKYSVKKYGFSGDGYAISKMQSLNFFEDWVISYELTYDNHSELRFYGYIK